MIRYRNKNKNKRYFQRCNTKRATKGTYYVSRANYTNLNERYNSNLDYNDIKCMFIDDEDRGTTSTSSEYKNYNNNHVFKNNKNLNKIYNKTPYIKNVCALSKFEVSLLNTCKKSIWLYDSGAGEHLTNDKSILLNYKEENISLKCANNTYMTFEGYGEFHFYINSHRIVLKRVLYSKEVSRNLLSGVELAKMNIKAITDIDKDKNVVLSLIDNYKNKLIGKFYSNVNNEILITAVHSKETKEHVKDYIFSVQKLNKESKLIWHRRLVHYYLNNMDEYLNVHNINDHLCDDCKIVKMKRKSHNQESPKANEILEVIHSDIIGPINDSYTGERYIITFIDEKSHKSWIYLMRKKNEAIDIIIKFINQLNNTFDGKKVKTFKSDNAKEYKNKKVIEFCEEKGIRKIYWRNF